MLSFTVSYITRACILGCFETTGVKQVNYVVKKYAFQMLYTWQHNVKNGFSIIHIS